MALLDFGKKKLLILGRPFLMLSTEILGCHSLVITFRKIYEEKLCLQGREKYVNCATYMRPYCEYAQGVIFTGSVEAIRAFDARFGLLLYKCVGHSSFGICWALLL